MDDLVRRPAVLLRHRDRRAGFQLWWLLPVELLQIELLRSGPDLLRSRPDLRRSLRSDVLRSEALLQSSVVLRSEVLQAQVLQNEVLQDPLLQVQLLRSRADLLRSGPDLRRSLRSDVRCSRGCLLQLV